MSDEYMDPSGNTAQFRAFASDTEADPRIKGPARTGAIAAGAVLAVVLLALIAWAVL